MLDKFKTPFGVIIISILLGLGLAGLFRQACQGPSCDIAKGPRLIDVENTSFRIGGKCYMYEPEIVNCNHDTS